MKALEKRFTDYHLDLFPEWQNEIAELKNEIFDANNHSRIDEVMGDMHTNTHNLVEIKEDLREFFYEIGRYYGVDSIIFKICSKLLEKLDSPKQTESVLDFSEAKFHPNKNYKTEKKDSIIGHPVLYTNEETKELLKEAEPKKEPVVEPSLDL